MVAAGVGANTGVGPLADSDAFAFSSRSFARKYSVVRPAPRAAPATSRTPLKEEAAAGEGEGGEGAADIRIVLGDASLMTSA